MNNYLCPAFLLIVIIVLDCARRIRSKAVEIWSPLTFFSLYMVYYVVAPSFNSNINISSDAHFLVQLGGLLFYLSFLLSFKVSRCGNGFKRFNRCFSNPNEYRKLGYIYFFIAFLGYTLVKGFSLNAFAGTNVEYEEFDESSNINNASEYLSGLISLFCVSSALLYSYKRRFDCIQIALIIIAVIIYLVVGSRFRLLAYFIVLATVLYLYPFHRKIKIWFLPLLLVAYLAMGVIEQARHYGTGIDINVAQNLMKEGNFDEIKSSENVSVYSFSGKVMETFEEKIYFEPIVCAILMPIPRSLFPWKPKGEYLLKAKMRIDGTLSYGSAFTAFTEAYIAFGWSGVILYGLIWGWLGKYFWQNYFMNRTTFASVLLLGLFNAVLYVGVSRGYMAQVLKISVFYIFIPFWIEMLLNKIKTRH